MSTYPDRLPGISSIAGNTSVDQQQWLSDTHSVLTQQLDLELGLIEFAHQRAQNAMPQDLLVPAADFCSFWLCRLVDSDEQITGGGLEIQFSVSDLQEFDYYGIRVPVYGQRGSDIVYEREPYTIQDAERLFAINEHLAALCATSGIQISPDLTSIQGAARRVAIVPMPV